MTTTNTNATGETRQLAASIIGRFEDYLDERDVEIENPERDTFEGDEETEPAIIFGADYYSLEDTLTEAIDRGDGAPAILSAFAEYLLGHGQPLPEGDRGELSARVAALLAGRPHDTAPR